MLSHQMLVQRLFRYTTSKLVSTVYDNIRKHCIFDEVLLISPKKISKTRNFVQLWFLMQSYHLSQPFILLVNDEHCKVSA